MCECKMCGYEFDERFDGDGANLKYFSSIFLCTSCVHIIETYMQSFGAVGGVINTAKHGFNPDKILL